MRRCKVIVTSLLLLLATAAVHAEDATDQKMRDLFRQAMEAPDSKHRLPILDELAVLVRAKMGKPGHERMTFTASQLDALYEASDDGPKAMEWAWYMANVAPDDCAIWQNVFALACETNDAAKRDLAASKVAALRKAGKCNNRTAIRDQFRVNNYRVVAEEPVASAEDTEPTFLVSVPNDQGLQSVAANHQGTPMVVSLRYMVRVYGFKHEQSGDYVLLGDTGDGSEWDVKRFSARPDYREVRQSITDDLINDTGKDGQLTRHVRSDRK